MTVSGSDATTRTGGENPGHGTELDGVRAKVFMDRYSLKDQDGTAIEHYPEQTWRRVARGIAEVEQTPEARQYWEERFYEAMDNFKFVPGGRILAGAGSGHAVTYYNCYVTPSPEDSRGGILDNLKVMTEIMARGGGVGINLSTLRPRGSYIKSVNGTASGPCSWAELYSVATGDVIQQGGSRRGALMIMLDDDHPDIEEFITAKRIDPLTNRPVAIEHANVSVGVSNAFMQAVKDDGDWQLQFPTKAQVAANPEMASKVTLGKMVKAREIWNMICESAWRTAEPGLVFLDRYNERSNTWYYENIRCVNPSMPAGTLVGTRGGIVPIESLEGQRFEVKSLDGQWAEATCWLSGEDEPLIEISFGGHRATRSTREHQWPVLREGQLTKVRADELRIGDYIPLNRNEPTGMSGNPTLTEEEGFFLGCLFGDGWVSKRRSGSEAGNFTLGFSLSPTSPAKGALTERFLATLNAGKPRRSSLTARATGELTVQTTDQAFLIALLERYGLSIAKSRGLPTAVWASNDEFVRGFVDGLLSTDGWVADTVGQERIGLSTAHRAVAEQFAKLLSFYGVNACITRVKNVVPTFPNGKTYTRPYERYEVVLGIGAIRAFANVFTLTHPEKAAALTRVVERAPERQSIRHRYLRVVDLRPAGSARVWDIRVEHGEHVFPSQWVYTGNCGEQGLPEWGVCNLGALNVSAFVHDGVMDYADLAEQSRVAMRFLDNVVDANLYFIKENEDAQMGTRRTGLGTMGLADALIKLGVAYGSAESVAVVEEIYKTIRDAAYDASAEIAAEKGSFGHYVKDKYLQGQFIRELPEAVQRKIAKHGIRNAVLLTQAPTGTTSLLAGVSSGIEPVFSFAMVRRDRTGEHVMYHPLLEAWKNAHPGEETPGYFVGANDLTPEDHIAVQATVQKYTDSSISKTVNAPNHHTVEEVKRLYLAAFDSGCKGVTYYRDGSRDAVLTHLEEKKPPKAEAPQVAVAAPVVPAPPPLPATIGPRPAVLHGYTRNIKAPEGTVNITVNSDDEGPLEVFVNVGRAGSDVAALAEALGRLISLTLRVPSPMPQDEKLREMVSQLRGIGGSRTVGFGPEQVRSLPDAVGKALGEHLDGHPALRPNPLQLALPVDGPAVAAPAPAPRPAAQPEPVAALNGHTNGHTDSIAGLATGAYQMTGNLCPMCGSSTLIHQEGCKKCFNCGHSEC